MRQRIRVLTARAALAASLVQFSLTSDASAATIQVPANFPTIQAALNASATGDTILVAPGTYNERINFNSKAVELRSTAGPNSTTIHGLGGTAVTVGGQAKVIGFRITGGSASVGAGMSVSGIGTTIRGNIFDGNAQHSGGFGAAIGGNGASPLIDSNIFRNNTADGQFLSGVVSFVNSSSPRIINNIFEQNPCRAINMTLPVGNVPEVINNTITGSTVGIRVDARIEVTAQIYRNNIITNNGIGMQTEFGTAGPTFTHNNVFGNGTNYSGWADQAGLNGNISALPLFVGPNDYHLLPGSAAIDAGTALNAPQNDFDGILRPQDGDMNAIAVFDIGAYERAVPEPSILGLLSAFAGAFSLRRTVHKRS